METKRLLNKIPEDVLSEKRFLDRISSRNLLEKDQEKDLSSIKFFKMMDYKIAEPTVEDLMVEIENIKENKLEDSNKYKIHPDDTPSQIMLVFAEEFLDILINQKSKDKKSYTNLGTKLSNSPDLLDAIIQDDHNKAAEFFNKNPDFFSDIDKKLDSYEPFAKRFLDEAWEKVYVDNYKEALVLVDEGTKLNNRVYNPHLFELKATCLLELKRLEEALSSINKAIEFLMQNPFDFDENIASFLVTRSSIKKELKDIEGSNLDEEISHKINSLWKANYSKR